MVATMTVLKKAPEQGGTAVPPPLSPARQQLAERNATRAALDIEEAALEQAASWNGAASQGVHAAREALEAATAALEQAKADSATSIVNAALGTAAPAGMSIKAARANVVDAQDALDAAMAARDAVQARLTELQERRSYNKNAGAKAAAVAVIMDEAGPAIAAMLDRIEAAQRELLKAGMALSWLDGAGVIPHEKREGWRDPMPELRIKVALDRLRCPPYTWNELLESPDVRHDVAWAETLDRLMLDAAAPLPIV